MTSGSISAYHLRFSERSWVASPGPFAFWVLLAEKDRRVARLTKTPAIESCADDGAARDSAKPLSGASTGRVPRRAGWGAGRAAQTLGDSWIRRSRSPERGGAAGVDCEGSLSVRGTILSRRYG